LATSKARQVEDERGQVLGPDAFKWKFDPETSRMRDGRLSLRVFAMTQNFVALRCDLDRIRTNIRNDFERSLATWQWRAKVPLIENESSRRCVVRKLTK
jgi:hypothetical protein